MDKSEKNTTATSGTESGFVGGSGSNFQMPLHYPRYTEEEYKKLPEWMLDHLLAQYGLSAIGLVDLESKREFIMGAFLWPAQPCSTSNNNHDQEKTSGFQTVYSFLFKKRL